MNKQRCVNCGICLDEGSGIECNTLKHIALGLVAKLDSWLNPNNIQPTNRICEPCLVILKSSQKRRLVNHLICLGCGVTLDEISFKIADVELDICRSWVPKELSVCHLSKVCQACYNRIKIFGIKTETEFIGFEDHTESDKLLDICTELKQEPECTESHNESWDIEVTDSDQIGNMGKEKCIAENEIDEQDSFSEEGIIKLSDFAEDSINEQNNSEEECAFINNNKDHNYCIGYEYIEKSLLEADMECPPEPNVKRKWNGSRKHDSDEDYVPRIKLTKHIEPEQSTDKETTDIVSEDSLVRDTLELTKYSRTFRIGCCIFKDCKKECVSLIPRTVRRRMIMEYNLYIPPLSRVCKEHLQDQNWEELLSNTTKEFTAYHCQDMKNIVKEACWTNFDFENIETVEARLVRYWFDVNKTEFNRIFNYFPKFKWFKESKTVFALYLMHLQKTSDKRISLLLKMDEKTVKRIIRIGRDIVKCDSFDEFKEKFLEDD